MESRVGLGSAVLFLNSTIRCPRRSKMNLIDLKRFGISLDYPYKKRYENYIGGKWVAPVAGEYFENITINLNLEEKIDRTCHDNFSVNSTTV